MEIPPRISYLVDRVGFAQTQLFYRNSGNGKDIGRCSWGKIEGDDIGPHFLHLHGQKSARGAQLENAECFEIDTSEIFPPFFAEIPIPNDLPTVRHVEPMVNVAVL